MEDLDATEYVFFVACAVLGFILGLEDGFLVALFCAVILVGVSICYYFLIRFVLEYAISEEKGRAIARKFLELIGVVIVLTIVMQNVTTA